MYAFVSGRSLPATAIDLLAFVGSLDHGASVIVTQDTSNGPKSTASWSRLIGCECIDQRLHAREFAWGKTPESCE
jgi:hypothetical protein